MPLSYEERLRLEAKAHELRQVIVNTVFHAGSGHLGGALSMVDAATLLYYKYLRLDLKNPTWPERDRFVMSKGHAGIGYVAILSDLGFIPAEDLLSFNLTGSYLGMHLDANKVKGVDASTGSLGHGLAMALGMGLAAKQQGKAYKTWCLLGDGECNEGAVWEAAMAIPHFKASNVITLVDRNHYMIDGSTEDVMRLEPFAAKWSAFGFETLVVDGHDFSAMAQAFELALAAQDKPYCVILDTVKGQGVDFAAGDYAWHYGAINEELAQRAKLSLEQYYQQRVERAKGAKYGDNLH